MPLGQRTVIGLLVLMGGLMLACTTETPPSEAPCSRPDCTPCEGSDCETEPLEAMVLIPAGPFVMGSPSGEGVGYERPVHAVTLGAFWLDTTEVTNAQYAAFLAENGENCAYDGNDEDCFFECAASQIDCLADYTIRSTCERPDGVVGTCADHPVSGVTWYGARSYCQWAGKRLPTDAEWERAANGPGGSEGSAWRRYPWSEPFNAAAPYEEWNQAQCPPDASCPSAWNHAPDGLDEEDPTLHNCEGVAWTPTSSRANCRAKDCQDTYTGTAPVGSFPDGASPEGIHDLSGNVWEWVQDCWHDDHTEAFGGFVGAPSDGSAWEDNCAYLDNFGAPFRVRRGGSFDSTGRMVRSRTRSDAAPYGGGDLGFRCASDEWTL